VIHHLAGAFTRVATVYTLQHLLRRGGFKLGENLKFRDHFGKEHIIEIGPKEKSEAGEWNVYLNVDHHERVYLFKEKVQGGAAPQEVVLSKEEILDLAKVGDVRTNFKANVCEICVEVGQEVKVGDKLAVIEAMKMQTPVESLVSGRVEKIFTEVGQPLKVGDKIMKIGVAE
jgi:biotin carboxyl carrier protein